MSIACVLNASSDYIRDPRPVKQNVIIDHISSVTKPP